MKGDSHPSSPPPAIVVHLVARLNQFFSKCFPRGIPSIFHFIRHQQVSLESRQLLCANDLIQQRTSPFVVVELCQEADDGEACQGGDYRILIPVESENAKNCFFQISFVQIVILSFYRLLYCDGRAIWSRIPK